MQEKRTSSFRYGIGMFGTSLPINMFRSLASAFYVIKMGLTLDNLALIVFIYTFIDAIDNPLYGILSDNTRTRWGRRKPWLVIATPLFMVFFIMFFTPPTLSKSGLFYWAMFTYIITGTLDSLINANYGALFQELFPEEDRRAKTNAIKQIFQLIAMVIGIAITPMIASAIGYTWTAVIYAVVALAVVLYMTFGIIEPPRKENGEKVNILSALRAMVTSKNFWILGFANAFYSAAMALVMASVPFFTKYALQIPDSQSTFLLGTVIIVALGGVVFWSSLVKKFGTVKVWRIALITLAVAFVPLYFANNLALAIVFSIGIGIGFSGVISTMDIMGAKLIDEDFNKYGIKRQGIYSSTMGFMNRLSGLFISFSYFIASKFYGFISGDEPGPNPGDASRFLLILFPLTLVAIGVAFSFFVKFKEINKLDTVDENNENTENIVIEDKENESGKTKLDKDI